MPGKLKIRISILITFLFGISSCNILNSNSEQPPEPVSATYEYSVTGGFAGSVQHTVIDSTGLGQVLYWNSSAAVPTMYTYRLTADEFDSLRGAFDSADFFSLDSAYLATQVIADGFNKEAAWNSDTASKTVMIQANAAIPPKLTNLLNVLNDLTGVIQAKGKKN